MHFCCDKINSDSAMTLLYQSTFQAIALLAWLGLPMEKIEGEAISNLLCLELNIYLSCIKATQAVCEQSYFLTTVVLDFKGLIS